MYSEVVRLILNFARVSLIEITPGPLRHEVVPVDSKETPPAGNGVAGLECEPSGFAGV